MTSADSVEAAPFPPARRAGAPLATAVVLGNDTVLAAHPATIAQLAHACAAAGFNIVVPPSWGDEIAAAEYLAALGGRTERVVVACACPRVSALIDAVAPSLPATARAVVVPPPVAAARYLRLVRGEPLHITYVGDCPAGSDVAIDSWLRPTAFLDRLARAGIRLDALAPDMPEGALANWSRYGSMSGGLPALRFLAREPVSRIMRVLDGRALAAGATVAARSRVLVDVTDAACCACGGDRDRVAECEPPRASAPIVCLPAAVRPAAAALPPSIAAPAPARAVAVPADAAAVRTDPSERAPEASDGDALPMRGAPLALLPVLVLAVVAALGAAVYAAALHRAPDRSGASAVHAPAATRGRATSGEPATVPASADRGARSANAPPWAESDTGATSPGARGATLPGPPDSARVEDRVAGDSTRVAGADRSAAGRPRPARSAPTYRVVPGWLPQGSSGWTPVDTSGRSVPDMRSPHVPDTTREPARPGRSGAPA